jgi:hypothetical protein
MYGNPHYASAPLASRWCIIVAASFSSLAPVLGFALILFMESHGVHIPLDFKLGLTLALGSGSKQAQIELKPMKANSKCKRMDFNPFPRSLTRVSGNPSVEVSKFCSTERA